MKCQKYHRALLLFALWLVCIPAALHGQSWSGILDPARAIDWSQAGAGAIPNRPVCTTVAAGASAATINAAIQACPANQAVLLSPGNYTISGTAYLLTKSNVTLRGSGPDQTFITVNSLPSACMAQTPVCIYNGDGSGYYGAPANGPIAWTATSYAKGQATITLASTPNLKVGMAIVLWQNDDSATFPAADGYYVCSSPGGNGGCSWQGPSEAAYQGHGQSQIVEVTSCGTSTPGAACTSTTAAITPGLHAPNWSASKSPKAWWNTSLPVTGVGLENLSIDCHGMSMFVGGCITFWNAKYSWAKNIRSNNNGSTNGYHYKVSESYHITIRDSYMYGASSSSGGYGVTFATSSCDNLAQNNISNHVTNQNVTETECGSVFGYNFAVDNTYTADTAWQQNDSVHHSTGDHMELWESNFGVGHNEDNIHGTNAMTTTFRNKWSGRDTGGGGTKTEATVPYVWTYGARYGNAVGNVLGTSGYHTVYQNLPASTTSCNASPLAIWAIGFSDADGYNTDNCNGAPGPGNDLPLRNGILRWGNYTVVKQSSDTPTNSGIRFVASEVPSGSAFFPNAVPASTTLPASFYLTARPSWWTFPSGNASTPWPAIGPDVTGGNNSTYFSGQTLDGHVYLVPAANCYFNVMGGLANGTSGWLTFNADNCYSSAALPPAPTNLTVVVN
jgi:hypothetical protein